MDVSIAGQVQEKLATLRVQYAKANPKSGTAFREASMYLPGGNTRSVLHFAPFPITMERGEGNTVWDLDGHQYLDCVGEFSAGLFGHSDSTIRAALIDAATNGLTLGAPTRIESALAAKICERFPCIELVRFCNSGTEANILALVTALVVTGRSTILVCREAYHGSVLVFADGGSPINLPFDFVLIDYNDTAGALETIRRLGDRLAAIIVEPILGAAGNIPGTRDFLSALQNGAYEVGALLIFDEIKTSRCGPGGIQSLLGMRPDLTTLGKYIGGGLPLGAFGGRKEIMSRYDPASPNALRHAGTFNNNVCSMASGLAGLTNVLTPETSLTFLARCEAFRNALNIYTKQRGAPISFVGLGSMFTIHFTRSKISSPRDISPESRLLAQLFHISCALGGVLIASRGDFFLSLPTTEADFETITATIGLFVDDNRALLERIT